MSTEESLSIPRVLPRGPHRLAREVVEASQRGRLLDAMARVVAEKGYGAASVADVIARAGVSRQTFYVHFRDKLDCFLAAYDTFAGAAHSPNEDAPETNAGPIHGEGHDAGRGEEGGG